MLLLPNHVRGNPPGWHDPSWTKRKPITITNTNPNSLIDYQVKINVVYDSSMKTYFSDLRFTDSDGATLISYWIQSYTASVSAIVWVKVPSVPASGAKTIWMYYGNPAAADGSNGPATFEFFDDFEREYASPWEDKQVTPIPRADCSAAVYNGKLYLFGGYNPSGVGTSGTYEYNPSTDSWTQKANMPTARWGCLAVEYNGKIYVFSGGGWSPWAVPILVNEVYDPSTDTWTTKSPVPSGFNHGLMGVRFGNKIDLFRGTIHYEYDPATDTYTPKAPMPTNRIWGTCAVVGSKIYVIGGTTTVLPSDEYVYGTSITTNMNEVYDPSTDTWTTKASMPIPKLGVTRENPVINGKIYATHGLSEYPDQFHTDNYVYDPSTDSWQQKSSAVHPRDGVACGVINNKLYVVGGRDQNGASQVGYYNEVYDPSVDTGIPPQWTFSDSAKVKRDASAKYEGNYGLMIYEDTGTTPQYAVHFQNLAQCAVDFCWDVTDQLGINNAAKQPQGGILLTPLAVCDQGSLWYYNNGGSADFRWYTGSFTTLQSGSWSNWYQVTIVWNGANSKVVINGNEYPVIAAQVSSDRIHFGEWVHTKMYIDLVRVRKYSSPEPTTTLGAEETLQYSVTFDQTGGGTDFTGTVVTIDSVNYNILPVSFLWDSGSSHTFSFSSPLAVNVGKQYVWTSTTGLTTLQSGALTMTGSGSVTGNYKTQYLLAVLTGPVGLTQPTRNPTGETGPAGSWWYDTSANVVLTAQPVTGYAFNYWDVDGSSRGTGVNPITVNMNAPHTTTAHYQTLPPPALVGGEWFPINKLQLLAPWISLVLTMAIAVSFVGIRRIKKRQD